MVTSNKRALWISIMGSLIAAVILWLLGLLPAAWQLLKTVFSTFAAFLGSSVSIPIWAFLLIIISSLSILTYFIKVFLTNRREKLTQNEVSKPRAEKRRQLTRTEGAVLAALSIADGEELYIDSIAKRIHENHLRPEQAVQSLIEQGFVAYQENLMYGTSLFLSGKGRDFVIELGIDKKQARRLKDDQRG